MVFEPVCSQASEAEAVARLLAHQPLLHLHPRHRARQRLQQRTLPGQQPAAQVRQHQLQPKLCPEQRVSPTLSRLVFFLLAHQSVFLVVFLLLHCRVSTALGYRAGRYNGDILESFPLNIDNGEHNTMTPGA